MSIKNYFLTGDCHGKVLERLANLPENCVPAETALIILGDAGLNFYLNRTDWKNKRNANNTGYRIYCLRGNHEERPENLFTDQMWDSDIDGGVYFEPEFPNIRYLFDGDVYKFDGYSVLTIGGAYSVDKWYRLKDLPEDTDKWTGWFKDEQLTPKEMTEIGDWCAGKKYDFVFTHTCPISWEPRDLFLPMINQDTVDRTMENWLDNVKDSIDWGIWCFAHYHCDRLERPYVEQYYKDVEEIKTIYKRWQKYRESGELYWWLQKSPDFYMR